MHKSDWCETFVILPKKSISGKIIFLKNAYRRYVWVAHGSTVFHIEPETEYGTLFDVLREDKSTEDY